MPHNPSNFFFNSAGGFYPHEIDGSLRFNDNDSAYLNRTFASAGNRQTWTWSSWVKRGNLGTDHFLFQSFGPTGFGIQGFIRFLPADTFDFWFDYNGGSPWRLITNQVFRDTSAWYHIVVVADTSNATSGDRLRLYVNGARVTSFGTANYPSLNANGTLNQNYAHTIGQLGGVGYFDGYMAEINFINGQALDPSSFGETKSGVWVPKEYAGTYGTNGFYLKFAGNVNDSSGNGNNWTANNITANDYMADSPTSNFCTMNPNASVSFDTGIDYQEGNLRTYHNGATSNGGIGTFRIPKTGKWYFEFSMNSASTSGFTMAGVISETTYASVTNPSTQRRGVYRSNGQRYNLEDNVAQSPSYSNYTTGDVIGVAVDNDNGYLYFAKNNVWQNSTNPSTGTPDANMDHVPVDCYPVFYNDNNSSVKDYRFNFGQDSTFSGLKTTGSANAADANGIGDFYYAPPTGFLALNTSNLPEPAISPADDESPSDHFNTVLYTGNGGTNSVTGVGFQPDWVWLKGRNVGYSHGLYDAVRGTTKKLISNLTNTEQTDVNGLTAFGADGFTLGSDAGTNQSGATYVSWNWKAGGTGVSNTAGSRTSTVSVNQDAGFSIVSWTANAVDPSTVGHGLGVAPDVIIMKARTGVTDNWRYGGSNLPSWSYSLALNSTNGQTTGPDIFNQTAPTSTVFTIGGDGSVNTNNATMIAYCFAEIEGYSKFGKYTGNGNADGPFVYTGFLPRYVLIKNTAGSTYTWIMFDSARKTYNVNGQQLYPNRNDSEVTDNVNNCMDFVSNGFKYRGASAVGNGSGNTIVYMAFAENPFKYANAR